MTIEDAKRYLHHEVDIYYNAFDQEKQETVEAFAGGVLETIEGNSLLLDWGWGIEISEVIRIEEK